MIRRWIRLFPVLTAAALAAGGCLPFHEGGERAALDSDPVLETAIRDYLRASDREAQGLLQTASGHPMPRVEAALLKVLSEPPPVSVPTGILPDQSISTPEGPENYGLFVPTDYDPSRAYPLIICLHGAGFDGNTYLERWKPRLGDAYLLACPSIPGGAWWTRRAERLVMEVLSEVARSYHVDPDRVFLTGMSNGGIGTFLIGLNYPDRFAALIPMAAAFPADLFPLLDNARDLPLYIIHGSRDEVMPVRYSREVAAYLKKKNYSVVYREHDRIHPMAGGHFFPREELPDLLEWMETRRRKSLPREVAAVRDRDHTGRGYWLRIDEIGSNTGSFWASENDREEGRRLRDGAFARVSARVSGNTLFVTSGNVRRFSLLIPPRLVNLDKPVLVIVNESVRFQRLLEPDSRILLEEARRRPDPGQLVVAVIEITISDTSERP